MSEGLDDVVGFEEIFGGVWEPFQAPSLRPKRPGPTKSVIGEARRVQRSPKPLIPNQVMFEYETLIP